MESWPQETIPSFADFDSDDWTDKDLVESRVALALKADARNRYPQVIASMNTSYNCSLESYQETLNKQRTLFDAKLPKLTILNLDKFIIGLAYGLRDVVIAKELLKQNGVDIKYIKDKNWKPHFSEQNRLSSPINYRQHYGAIHFKPHFCKLMKPWYNFWNKDQKDIPLMVPQIDYSMTLIQGLDHHQYMQFVNLHEGHHFLDPYFLNGQPNLYKGLYTPDLKKLYKNKRYRKRVLTLHKAEGFADMGALGQMIKDGEETSIIDAVIEGRKNDIDFGHQTADMLEGFKIKLAAMGRDKFCALDTKSTVDFYKNVIDTYAPTADELQLAAGKVLNVVNENKQIPRHVLFIAVRLKTMTEVLSKQKESKTITYREPKEIITGDESYLHERKEQIQTMDAMKELTDRAFATGGCITPLTMTAGFISALEERRSQKEVDKDYQYTIAEMIKLQTTFANDRVDYVHENEKRGLALSFDENGVPVFKQATADLTGVSKRVKKKPKLGLK